MALSLATESSERCEPVAEARTRHGPAGGRRASPAPSARLSPEPTAHCLLTGAVDPVAPHLALSLDLRGYKRLSSETTPTLKGSSTEYHFLTNSECRSTVFTSRKNTRNPDRHPGRSLCAHETLERFLISALRWSCCCYY